MEPIRIVCDIVTIIFMEDISSLFAPSTPNAEVSKVSLMLHTLMLITLIQTQQTVTTCIMNLSFTNVHASELHDGYVNI